MRVSIRSVLILLGFWMPLGAATITIDVTPDAVVDVGRYGLFSVTAYAPNCWSPCGQHAHGSIDYEEDLDFTVYGGQGTGRFAPCMGAAAVGMFDGNGGGQAQFGSISESGWFNCWLGQPATLPFTFGVTVPYHLRLYAYAANWSGYETETITRLFHFEFYDNSGNPLSGLTYTLTPLTPLTVVGGVLGPEPGTFSATALLLGVMMAWAAARKRSRSLSSRKAADHVSSAPIVSR